MEKSIYHVLIIAGGLKLDEGFFKLGTKIASVYILHGKASLGGVCVHLIVHNTNLQTASLNALA